MAKCYPDGMSMDGMTQRQRGTLQFMVENPQATLDDAAKALGQSFTYIRKWMADPIFVDYWGDIRRWRRVVAREKTELAAGRAAALIDQELRSAPPSQHDRLAKLADELLRLADRLTAIEQIEHDSPVGPFDRVGPPPADDSIEARFGRPKLPAREPEAELERAGAEAGADAGIPANGRGLSATAGARGPGDAEKTGEGEEGATGTPGRAPGFAQASGFAQATPDKTPGRRPGSRVPQGPTPADLGPPLTEERIREIYRAADPDYDEIERDQRAGRYTQDPAREAPQVVTDEEAREYLRRKAAEWRAQEHA